MDSGDQIAVRTTDQSPVRRSYSDRVRVVSQEGIRDALLSRCGDEGETVSAQTAADLHSNYGGSGKTRANRSSHIKKWFAFCDEDERPLLAAKEADVLAYIGYLHLDGPTSVAQYVTAISRYNEVLNFASPTHTPMAFAHDLQGVVNMAPVGLSAGLMRQIVECVLHAADQDMSVRGARLARREDRREVRRWGMEICRCGCGR